MALMLLPAMGSGKALNAPPVDTSDHFDFMTNPSLYLYFADRQAKFLHAVERPMPEKNSPEELAKEIIMVLIAGPGKGDFLPTIPDGTRLRAFYLNDSGVAYVDFNREIYENHPGGIMTERLTLYSIVNSLILNISKIKTVKILIDGQESKTLTGHLDLRFPLTANMLIVR